MAKASNTQATRKPRKAGKASQAKHTPRTVQPELSPGLVATPVPVEVPKGDKRPQQTGTYATPQNKDILKAASRGKGLPGVGKLTASDPSRQDYGTQIRALKRKIEELLREIAFCVQRRQHDKATLKCLKVAELRGKLLGVVQLAQDRFNAEPVKAVDKPHKSPFGSREKAKREVTVFDLAMKYRKQR